MPAWLTWTFVALVSWGLWAVLSKGLGNALSAAQSQAISTLGILPVLAVLALAKGAGLGACPRKGVWLAFAGGIASCLGNLAYYGALTRGDKVATVVSLTALYPLITILLAMALLRERLNRIQLAGIGLSFVAIWLFNIQGDSGLFSRTVAYAILPIVFYGLSGFLQKVATNHLSAESAALIYLGAFVPVAILLAAREPWPAAMTPRVWALVLALGFFLAFGNFALLAAFARGGKAAVIVPLSGLYPMVGVPIAVLAFGDQVGLRELFGIAIALTSVVALSMETVPPKPRLETPVS